MLVSYNFQINHVRGTENERVDALSRRADYSEGTEPGPTSILKKIGDQLIY